MLVGPCKEPEFTCCRFPGLALGDPQGGVPLTGVEDTRLPGLLPVLLSQKPEGSPSLRLAPGCHAHPGPWWLHLPEPTPS